MHFWYCFIKWSYKWFNHNFELFVLNMIENVTKWKVNFDLLLNHTDISSCFANQNKQSTIVSIKSVQIIAQCDFPYIHILFRVDEMSTHRCVVVFVISIGISSSEWLWYLCIKCVCCQKKTWIVYNCICCFKKAPLFTVYWLLNEYFLLKNTIRL